eukprot:scaffold203672_cov21-Tisochrysis_lutea.AAC.2
MGCVNKALLTQLHRLHSTHSRSACSMCVTMCMGGGDGPGSARCCSKESGRVYEALTSLVCAEPGPSYDCCALARTALRKSYKPFQPVEARGTRVEYQALNSACGHCRHCRME